MFHYTDKDGWNAIRSQPTWRFKASRPKDPERPVGAYFTDIEPHPANLRLLHKRLRMPKTKQAYTFEFAGAEGLRQHCGGQGRDRHIFYSPGDYEVEAGRQTYEGPTEAWSERLHDRGN